MRRLLAVGAAVVLVLEALTVAFANWILGLAVRRQNMSLAGSKPDAMAVGAWVAGGVFALFLLVCAGLVVRIAVRDAMVGRVWRIVLIVCAVIQGVMGAAVVGLVGWFAFVALMVVLALLVGTLLAYAPEDEEGPRTAPDTGGEVPPPAAPPATA
ncbi:hypothetical protein [Actinacidiphila guanduensis]|uniref:Uncharacterized protein n=1 Tax=Actinacidiphila guanduensis TaxID=310781 RepID=A0A1H0AIQ9_9ACTN|nr:hypothetical protein [Actinacidiphila guanduensis]SDN32963.1 hypothetical protein SAMN05216259_103548 [Actinacidiphila guanduensis]